MGGANEAPGLADEERGAPIVTADQAQPLVLAEWPQTVGCFGGVGESIDLPLQLGREAAHDLQIESRRGRAHAAS